ncbi:MAG: peptidase domain-containing ABC transporter [Gammaproteobacteria bacterium]|nr:peptidase domain-containing ABC transporter [Gammaproteobacteria bacterium]
MGKFVREGGILTHEQQLWLLASFCTLHRLAFDPALFAQRHPLPGSAECFPAACDELGLALRQRRAGLEAVLAWRLPVALAVRSGAAPGSNATDWLLVLNADEQRAVVLERGAPSPAGVELAALRERYAGTALCLTPQSEASADPDAIEPRAARFGLRWFLPELLRHRPVWRDVLAGSLLLQLMGLALPLFTQAIIDKVVVHRTRSTLVALGIAMTLFMVFTSLLSWIRQYLVLHTGQRIDAVLGAQVFDRLFRLPLPYFQQRPTGVIAARLQGIETIREFIASAAVTVALDIPFLLVFVAVMFWYSVGLTLLVLAILGLVAGASLLVAPLFQEKLNEQFRRGAANQAFLTEYVSGIETVKSLQFEPQLNQRYRGLLAEYLKAGFATRQLANTYNTWANGLEQLMTLLILVLGAWIVMHGTSMTIGMLVAFQMFAGRISQPMLRMVGLWQQWQQTRMAVARLGDVMNAPAEPFSLKPRRAPGSGAGAVQVEDLAFRYAGHAPLLFERLSLELKPGQLVALMGPSGSGKSTLAKLLQGFYPPTSGRIRLDGIDIAHLAANELRTFFGVVPQETVLFSGTILDNLRLANPYATFEQAVAACRMAEIHATIEALPEGYQTPIGERGAGLSGGQRQRLAIARALLKGPKILIFDEATSSLDPLTAEQVGRTISALKGRVSILFIAHQIPKSVAVDHVVRIGEKLSVVPIDPLEQGAAG